jgi:predicted lysophospholipase L1 biosynthesis ABC-type transport system permease subunit
VGVAALCILLALITLAAVGRADHRLRLGDLAVLRALGFRAAQQSAVRRGEWWIVAASGLLAGAIIGTLAVLLTIPQLTSAALPEPIPGLSAAVRIDLVLVSAGAVVLLGGIALLGELAAARVRRDALRALGGEETR